MIVYSLGVDISVNKTEALLLSEGKLTLGSFKLQGANFQRDELRKIKRNLTILRDIIFKNYNLENLILTVGIAGVWRRSERKRIKNLVEKISKSFSI